MSKKNKMKNNNLILFSLFISFVLHLVLNNFKCMFWETGAGFEFCYYTGIGQPKSKMYFWGEVFFQVFIGIFVLKNLKRAQYINLLLYIIYELYFFSNFNFVNINTTRLLSWPNLMLLANSVASILYLHSVWQRSR